MKTCEAFPQILEDLKQQLKALNRVIPGEEQAYLEGTCFFKPRGIRTRIPRGLSKHFFAESQTAWNSS